MKNGAADSLQAEKTDGNWCL